MRPVPVLLDYLVKLVIPASCAIQKPAVIYRFVSLDCADLGTTVPRESYHHVRPSPMRLNELRTCPDNGAARAKAPGC